MGDLERYIVEEWAEDFHSGRLNRREFLRRVALMVGGTAVALPVLRELGVMTTPEEVAAASSSAPVVTAQAGGITVPPDDPALQAGGVTFPMGPVAKLGYAALAVDLASAEGGTAKYSDLAEVTAILGRTPPDQLVAMLNAGVAYLQGQSAVRKDRIGAVGFCFGGGMTWLLATRNSAIRAAVPFYGPNPPLEDVPQIKAAILAIYGELDSRIDAGIPAIREAMKKTGMPFEVVIYPGADHAFFNDTGQRYHAPSALDAWRRTVAWFDRYLKGS